VKFDATATEIRALVGLAQRNAAAQTLPRPLLERYQWLIGAGRSPAVVPIEKGVCSGCHVRLPTMLEHRAACSLALYTCPYCRRLLYAPGLLGEDPRPPAKAPRRARGGPSPTRREKPVTAEQRS
jgi:predicted  nucleic acid-binding Zn-ribbon protein